MTTMLRRSVYALVAALALNVWVVAPCSADVKPLGYPMGKTTVEGLTDTLPAGCTITERGTSRVTNGPLIRVDGNGFDIEGLQQVTFIFTVQGQLDAVLMQLDRGTSLDGARFNQIMSYLESQYKLTKKKIPFVGNKFAAFHAENITIELDSPHLDFRMYVDYMTDDFRRAAKKMAETEKQQQNSTEKSQF